MATLSSIITDYAPSNGQIGVPLRSTITIEFDRLMDTDSIEQGFYVEGPDSNLVLGPGSSDVWESDLGKSLGQYYDFLDSPGQQGIVQGEFSFDDSGSVTTMTFTPSYPLAANTEYTANIVQAYSRSIGDTVVEGGNLGNGDLDFGGTYTGTATDEINIRITASGVAGLAEFEWWRTNTPLNIHGPILSSSRGEQTIEPGIYVLFGDGSFYVDDEFNAPLTSPTLYSGQMFFTFTAGSGSIEALPSTSSTSILATLRQGSTVTTPLQVVKTTPANYDVQIDPDTTTIIVEFNKQLDDSTIDESNVTIETKPATDHPATSITYGADIAKRVTVNGRRIIITL